MKLYTYPSPLAEKRLAAIANRGVAFKKKDFISVSRILEDVRQTGDRALITYTRRFDCPDAQDVSLRVQDDEIKAAGRLVAPSFRRALNRAAAQIEAFHRLQKQTSWMDTPRPGVMLGQLVRPVETAGVYVPGGQGGNTPLVSSVLMGAIPAKLAGVDRVVMVTPPTASGQVNPHLLVAAQKAGVDAVFKVGGPWAIGALAYGTETIPKADVIVGPGNIYVTIAKKIVAGTVGIDMIAGPSEVLVIADDTAQPEFAAADLLSQAEHDPLSSAILVTDSRRIAQAVAEAVASQLETLARSEIARQSIRKYGAVFKVPDTASAVALANRIAPEHLELHVADPYTWLHSIRHAGAVFLGAYTPEPAGDYVAGPNHVLPTAGAARYASALSVSHFMKKTSLIHYSAEALRREAGDIVRLAETEGLDAHARAVRLRIKHR